MPWKPETYLSFREEREEPFKNMKPLLRADRNLKVVDLGCGAGNLTRKLSEELPGSQITGIDSSREMISEAEKNPHPSVRYDLAAIESLDGCWDPDLDLPVDWP